MNNFLFVNVLKTGEQNIRHFYLFLKLILFIETNMNLGNWYCIYIKTQRKVVDFPGFAAEVPPLNSRMALKRHKFFFYLTPSEIEKVC